MRRITHEGLRRHIEEKVIIGESERDIIQSSIGSFPDSGLLLEDEFGFYVNVREQKVAGDFITLFHQRRINPGNAIVILGNEDNNYNSGWYQVDLSSYVSKNHRRPSKSK